MELKGDFVTSDVGPIPRDWRVKRLSEIASVSAGGTPSREVARYWNGTIPWVTTSQIDFNEISSAEEFITDAGLRNSAAKLLEPGTLVMALYGQGKTRGKIGALAISAATNQACASISVSAAASSDYVRYFLTSRYEAIRSASNAGGQENLSGGILKGLAIALPPTLNEQRAIASALADVDALIASLDRLIGKKRDLKQAAMQQLLTGQARLPGFGGRWRPTSLGDLGRTYGGLVGKTGADFGVGEGRYVPFMNVMANVRIDPEWLEQVRVTPCERQNVLRRGDLLFNGSSETPGELGLCSVLDVDLEDVHLNSFCFGFRFGEGVRADGAFFAYFFRSSAGRRLLGPLAQGAIRYNLSKTALLRVRFDAPQVLEQSAIAAVLMDMDAEISALEKRLAKTRLLKQGMMQELLTGRTRLV